MKRLFLLLLAIGLSILFILPGRMAAEEKLKFVGATKCKMCHNLKKSGKYFDDWKTKKHYQSFFLLKGDERKDPKCLKCHTTAYGEPGGFKLEGFKPPFEKFEDIKSNKDTSTYIKAMLGVQCEMCHGPGEKHVKSKKGKTVIPHAWEPEEKVCTACHNSENPHWNPEKYTDKDGKKTGFDYEQAAKIISHKVEKTEKK